MKYWIVLFVLLFAAYLYGWRFHPEHIGAYMPGSHAPKQPIFEQVASQNAVSHWRPQDFLDNFNGNKEFRAAHPNAEQRF